MPKPDLAQQHSVGDEDDIVQGSDVKSRLLSVGNDDASSPNNTNGSSSSASNSKKALSFSAEAIAADNTRRSAAVRVTATRRSGVGVVSPYDDYDDDAFIGSPLAPRVTNGRRSFAAALWNPMSDEEKRSFNKKRFIQLVIGIFMGVMVGVQYAFGVVSKALKERAGFSQSDMTTITTVGNCLFAFTFPAGVLFDYAGPKPVLICAMVFGCTGFSLLAMIFAGVIEPTVATVAIANGLPNWQAGFLESGTLLPSLFMFPTNKGEVVILQKTFFGLGSTFLSLSFDGFFSESDDYEGYCIYVASLIFIAILSGTFVTRLPTYKRTTRELAAIAKMSPADAERAKMMEEQSFEMHHNPRLSDRRRLNYGVTMLLITLVFFASLSFIKAFIHIETHVVMVLTFLALGCIASFAVMLYPRPLPEFFDYEFLPDIHPPEELVDKPEPTSSNTRSRNKDELLSSIGDGGARGDSTLNTASMTTDPRSPNDYLYSIGSNSRGSDAGSPSMAGRGGAGSPSFAGRASQFMAHRASVAGGSMIAIPKAVSPMAIPSINTKFLDSLKHPFIWCFWFTTFALMGTNFVVVNNITQIYVALNNGEFVKSSNSLNVALIGIGSAIGRICAGFGETYLHRINAIHRDRQLEYMARQELNLLTSDDVAPDMTPVYHRWNASIVMVLPIAPMIVSLMCVALLFMPPAALGVVLIVFAMFVGVYLGLLALSVREIFSVDVAKHLNFILSAGMVATVLLNRLMFGMWYDAEFDRQQGGSSNNDLVDGTYHYYGAKRTFFGAGGHPLPISIDDSPSAFLSGDQWRFNAGADNETNVTTTAASTSAIIPTTTSEVTTTTTTAASETTLESTTEASTSTSASTTTPLVPTTTDATTTDAPPLPTETTTNATTTAAPPAANTECVGRDCIMKSLLVLAGVNVLAVFSVSFVVWHWWQVRKTF